MPSDNSEWLELYATFTMIGILRGFRMPRRMPIRVVRYVLSAKNHELGYSIIINNSVEPAHEKVNPSHRIPSSDGVLKIIPLFI